jgi:uncharacterized membrane protein YdbT with pleckstrin-like domain
MKELRKTYLSCYWYAVWSIFLLEIPFLIRFFKIRTRHYTYDEKNLHIEEGVFSKETMTIPLHRIETISAKSNLFGNGTVSIHSKGAGSHIKAMQNLEYIRNVKAVKTELMNAIEAARERLGVKSIDTF